MLKRSRGARLGTEDVPMKAIARRSVRSVAVFGAVLVVGFGFSTAAKAAPGNLDPSFSKDGKQTTDVGGGRATGVAIQSDGKIVAVGFGLKAFELVRYNPNGSLDTSFSKDGKQATDFGRGYALGVALQPNGKIVVVGKSSSGGGDFALARYNPNGSLDKSFSGDGKVTTNFGGDPSSGGDEGAAVAIQANGKIVAAGYARVGHTGSSFALARYNPDGSLDRSFSGDGRQTTGFGGGIAAGAGAVAIQANGRIVAVGGGGGSFVLARYDPNGALDATFSGDGKQTTDFGPFNDGAGDVAIQPNGRIVAAGTVSGGTGSNFALARYNPNGSLDPSFSGDGKQTTDFGGGDGASGVAIQADGKIVAVGETVRGSGRSFALARYNPNGSLDPSFSGDGRQTTDFPGDSDEADDVAIQADGKIVAAGIGDAGTFALARYLGG